MHGDIVDHLHHDNSLSNTCTAEETHFAATREGDQQIHDLHTCLKDVNGGVLLNKLRAFTVNR